MSESHPNESHRNDSRPNESHRNESRPNIVLVSIDSLRADHCGYLGDDRDLTPALDELAADGVAYRNALSPGPQTFSAMPVAFTGVERPPTSRLVDDDGEWKARLTAIDRHLRRYESLPERLQRRGYATAGFSPNPWTSTASGFDRGFDHFVDVSGKTSDGWFDRVARRVVGDDPNQRSVDLLLNMLAGTSFFAQWESFYDDLAETIRELPEPYFVWVFLLDTHFPFVTSRRHRSEQSALGMYYGTLRSHRAMRGQTDQLSDAATRRARTCYRDTVRAADAFLGRFHDEFVDDDTVTVVHSDHGESFGDHGNYGHHHRQVYEENVHVPYVVHGTETTAAVDRPSTLASLPDVVSAIASDGTFDPRMATDDVVVASSENGETRTARGARFKYVEQNGSDALYDLNADSDETTDVSSEHPEVRRRLARELRDQTRRTEETTRLDRAIDATSVTDRF